MNVENRVNPDPDQLRVFMEEPGPDGPIVMVNLLKYRETAVYPDGRDADLPGRVAYMRYGMEFARQLWSVGGMVLFTGNVTFLSLGRADLVWDEVALAEYPSRTVFREMVMSPEYQAIAVHREAGLEGQLNLETVPTLPEALRGLR